MCLRLPFLIPLLPAFCFSHGPSWDHESYRRLSNVPIFLSVCVFVSPVSFTVRLPFSVLFYFFSSCFRGVWVGRPFPRWAFSLRARRAIGKSYSAEHLPVSSAAFSCSARSVSFFRFGVPSLPLSSSRVVCRFARGTGKLSRISSTAGSKCHDERSGKQGETEANINGPKKKKGKRRNRKGKRKKCESKDGSGIGQIAELLYGILGIGAHTDGHTGT